VKKYFQARKKIANLTHANEPVPDADVLIITAGNKLSSRLSEVNTIDASCRPIVIRVHRRHKSLVIKYKIVGEELSRKVSLLEKDYHKGCRGLVNRGELVR
jgi:hypothetical protein